MLRATYSIDAEELRETMRIYEELESREKRAPRLLKLFMGKGRPKYSWQVWLSNNWPTKEIPKERRLSTLMANELSQAIEDEILEEIMSGSSNLSAFTSGGLMINEIVEAIKRIKEMEKDTELWCVQGFGLVRIPKSVKISDVVLTMKQIEKEKKQ